MAGKNFKSGMDSLLSNAESDDSKSRRERAKPIMKAKLGLKEGWIRATLTVRDDHLEALRALAYWDRVAIKSVTADALNMYLDSRKNDIGKATKAYRASLDK